MRSSLAHPMKVLLVEPFSRGGTAQYTYQLARALSASRCRVILLAPRDYELAHRFSNARPSLSFAPWFLPSTALAQRASNRLVRRALLSLGVLANAFRLISACQALRPDVIHLHGGQIAADLAFVIAGRAAARLIGGKLAYSVHSTPPHRPTTYQWALHHLAYSLPDALIAYTDDVRRHVAGTFGIRWGRVKVIPTPVFDPRDLFDMDKCPTPEQARAQIGLPPDGKVILLFGQIRQNKGLLTLVEAFARVREAMPRARLLIVGQPHSGLSEALALADRLGAKSGITLVARYVAQEEVPHYFLSSDVVALPYLRITQSAVLALALGFRKPLVVSSVGGLPQMVKGCEFARTVPPNDSEALAAAILQLLSAPPRTDRTWSGEISPLSVARQTAAVYAELVSGRVCTNW